MASLAPEVRRFHRRIEVLVRGGLLVLRLGGGEVAERVVALGERERDDVEVHVRQPSGELGRLLRREEQRRDLYGDEPEVIEQLGHLAEVGCVADPPLDLLDLLVDHHAVAALDGQAGRDVGPRHRWRSIGLG